MPASVESPPVDASPPAPSAPPSLSPDVRAFLNAVPDAVVLLSATHEVEWVNQAFTALFGFSEAEAVGRRIRSLIVPPRYRDEAEHVGRSLRSGTSRFLDTMRQHRDGSAVAVTVSATPVQLGGTKHSLIYYRHDVERQEAQQERLALLRQLRAQREELRATLAQMPAGVFIAEGRARDIVFANDQATTLLERLARKAPDRPLSFTGFGVDGQPYSPDIWPVVRSLREAETVSGLLLRLRTIDGEWMTLRVSARPLSRGPDMPPRAVAVLEDVTAQHAREHAYQTLVERSLQGFALMRLGRVLFANEQFASMFGRTAAELMAMRPEDFFTLVHPDDRAAVVARAKRRVERGEATNERHRVRVLTPSQNVRWLEVAGCHVQIDGESTSQLSTYDITEYVQLEEHLQRAQHFEAIGQLAAGISHEINTPAQYATDNVRFAHEALTRMMSGRESQPDAIGPTLADELREVPEALLDALEGLQRIRSIVQGVKAFAHPGNEEARPLDLAELINKAVEVSKNEWKHDAEVSCSHSSDLPAIPCREAALGQAVLNVLVNAAQAIRERRRSEPALQGRITVRTVHDTTHALISIRDNGVGIPRDQQRRVFEPFFTTKAIGEGTGYGLSQVYRTVQEHNGTIWIDSTVNKGTTLTMRLPLTTFEGPGP